MQSFSVVLLASALAVSVSAGSGHAHHNHLHAKKGEFSWAPSASVPVPSANATSCGCSTYTTTWYGEPTLVQDQPTFAPNTTSSTSTWVAPTTSSTSSWTSSSTSSSWVAPTTSAAPTTSSESSSSVWAAPTSAVAAAVNDAAAPLSSGADSGTISTNGNQWAMTYTPYADDGSCKTAAEVSSDIASISAKGFTTVRLYATDCSGPQNIGAAAKANGMKMILGIYVDSSGIGSNTDEQISTLTQWGQGQWDMVEMVVAGNEAIFSGFCTAAEMASFIWSVKSQFKSAGYTGPVTTTEPLGTIQENAATICAAVDVIAANIHPFFNTGTPASDAGPFVASSLGDLAACCNNEKEAYNLETGWPSSGLANGLAIPGSANQKTAVESIMQSAGSKSAIFSFQNDMWKAPGSLDVEQFWGCSDLFSG